MFVPTLLAIVMTFFLAAILWLPGRAKHHGPHSPSLLHYLGRAAFLIMAMALLGFLIGFIVPVVEHEGSQGPLLGVYLTGPLGALLGLLANVWWLYRQRRGDTS